MELTPDFRKVTAPQSRTPYRFSSPIVKFPLHGDTPAVAIDFDGTLAEYGADSARLGKPVKHALWALQTFKANGWEVEVFTLRGETEPVWNWIDRYAQGLIDRVNESREMFAPGRRSSKPLVDLFIDDRNEYWFGREVNWLEVMVRLDRRGVFAKGLLPLAVDRSEEMGAMIASFEEPIFQGIISELRDEVEVSDESYESLIKSVEDYAKHSLGSQTENIMVRAKIAGGLLESVLKLIVRDRFDPVGCIILAQQG